MIATILGLFAGVASQPMAAMPAKLPLVRVAPVPMAPSPPRPPAPPPEGAFVGSRARAMVSLPSLFSRDDYPAEARNKRETGTASFAVAVDRDGRVADCTITNSSGSASLDQATCSVIERRGLFRPARDASGRTVEDRTDGRVRWVLPPPPPPAPAPRVGAATRPTLYLPLPALFSTDDYPMAALRNEETGTVAFRVVVGLDGRVANCTVTASSGSASLDHATCAIIQRRARFFPARDAHGRKNEDRSEGRVRWDLPPQPLLAFADQKSAYVFTTDAAGTVAGCRFEGPADHPANDQCPSMMSEARSIAAEAGKTIAIKNRELVLEEGVLVGGPDSARNVGRGPGETFGSLLALALDVDATGTISRCVAAAGTNDSQRLDEACKVSATTKFVPLDAAATDRSQRHAVRYSATYTRPIG